MISFFRFQLINFPLTAKYQGSIFTFFIYIWQIFEVINFVFHDLECLNSLDKFYNISISAYNVNFGFGYVIE